MALELLAHARFHMKQYAAALPVFQNLLQLSGKKSQQKSEWFLLLCYLANYNTHKNDFNTLSKKVLADNDHDFYKKTTELLNRLTQK